MLIVNKNAIIGTIGNILLLSYEEARIKPKYNFFKQTKIQPTHT